MAAAGYYFSLPQIADQLVKSFFIDDTAIIIAVFRTLAIELQNGGLYRLQQFVLDGCMHQEIIGRNTGLPDIREFGKYDATRRRPDMRVTFHHDGALAAQFEGDRHEIGRSQLINGTPDRNASRKKNMIEPERTDHGRNGHRAIPLHHSDIVRRKQADK